jgi:hypothetical protein
MARQTPLISTYVIFGISCLIVGAYVAALLRVVTI